MSRIRGLFIAWAITMSIPAIACAQPCRVAQANSRVSPRLRSLVDRIDDRGLRRFAGRGAYRHNAGWSSSPLFDWYFDTIASGKALVARPDGTQRFLASLAHADVDLSALVWANPRASGYSTIDARRLAQNFCVRTVWSKSGDGERTIERWQKLHAPKLTFILENIGKRGIVFVAGMSDALALTHSSYNGKMPFYSSNGVRGTYILSSHASSIFYLFWGDRRALLTFRKSLDLMRWDAIRKEFHPTFVKLSNVSYRHAFSFSRKAPDGLFWGTSATPQFPYQEGISGSGFVKIGSRDPILNVAEGVAGYSSRRRLRCPRSGRGQLICPGVNWEPYSLPTGKQRFSGVAPMIYVVVEPRTGAILFLGSH